MNDYVSSFICFLCLFTLICCGTDRSDVDPNEIAGEHRYYVSPLGSDRNEGNHIDKPWKTIEKAANTLQAGDTVFIREGVYHEIVLPKHSGTVDKRITYTAYPNETAVIDGSRYATTYLSYYDRGVIDIKSKKYIDIIGLHIINSGGAGITSRYGASHIRVINNFIKNCKAPGIAMGYSRENYPLATHIFVAGNYVENCAQQSREAISLRSVDTFEIKENTVVNTPKEGIDAKSGSSNGRIYGNKVSNAGAVGIYIDAGYPDDLYRSLNNIMVYNNELKNCRTSIAVASENRNLGEKIYIYNNLIYDVEPQRGDGIVLANYGESGSLKNIQIVNNTIVGKGHRGIYINNLNVDRVVIRNNICSQNKQFQIDIKSNQVKGVDLENNLIDGKTIDKGLNPVIGNPKFLQGDNFRLQSSSPAIDKGSPKYAPSTDYDNQPRPKGKGIDIGAFEF